METDSTLHQGGDGGGPPNLAGTAETPSKKRRMLPVWFFVGIQLLIFGVLIEITGIVEYSHLPHTVLANLHAPIWWGALLTVMGAYYVYRYWPRKKTREEEEN